MADENAIFQHAFYIGNNFNCILYGIELVLYFYGIYLLLQSRKRHACTSTSTETFFLVFSTISLLLITIQVAVQSVFGELMWISNADFPGGSAAYLGANASVWYQTMGSGAMVLLTVMSDSLLIYRCYVVWNNVAVVIFPIVLNVTSLALGIALCYFSGVPNSDFFAGLASHLALSFRCVVIGLNVLVSALICGRIAHLARAMRGALGADAARTYTGAAALLTESAALYTLAGVAYVVALGIGSPLSIVFLSVYAMLTCVAPQMIIVRVLVGRGWGRTTLESSCSMQFATRQSMRGINLESDHGTAVALGKLASKDGSKSNSTVAQMVFAEDGSQV
ncbi:hypothetical protein PsYK624_085090 [Phanerochaete sordida]|uniref:Transmembrane protein n=1 Tax=Phanerochaete sordida TaxID=48140 RepID=A0A9P3GEM3_9APHY|nr:hypothetical protein PsYK624_085090 [Phanerochaete sordida]